MQRLTRVGVGSMAKFMAITSALMALIFCIPYGLIVMLLGGAAGAGGDNPLAAIGGGLVGGLMIMILGPLLYLVFGFIFGAIYAFFINIALKFTGGLELELS